MGDTPRASDEREADPGFLILMSLANGPKHGYAMIEDIEGFAGVRLSSGTLYGAIARLAKRGLIDPLVTDDRRQPYRLTLAGAEIVRSKLAQLAEMASSERFQGILTLPIPFRPGERIQGFGGETLEERLPQVSARPRDDETPLSDC